MKQTAQRFLLIHTSSVPELNASYEPNGLHEGAYGK
jgi:hypothetical protein